MEIGQLNRAHGDACKNYPLRMLQFGGGNFLRAFVDWMVQILNEETDFDAGIAVVKPTAGGDYAALREQQGLFHVVLDGIKKGKLVSEVKLVEAVQEVVNPHSDWEGYLALAENPNFRFIVSNTTESGIRFSNSDSFADRPPNEFPAKLTQWLYKRYKYFGGDTSKGCIFLPCELIEDNGEVLKETILQYAEHWGLEVGFSAWIQSANYFCNTLVDRIVSGYPADRSAQIQRELGKEDKLLVAGEQYHSWVIQAPDSVIAELPFAATDLNVVFTQDLEAYRTLKVRILNGAHTALVPVGYLYGIDKVRESVMDPIVGNFLREVLFKEICPGLDYPQEEVEQFAHEVMDRFKNPYVEHRLISISLNSISKYKTRVLPSVEAYMEKYGELPQRLLFSLAALLVFYRGKREGQEIALQDSSEVLEFFKEEWQSIEHGEQTVGDMVRKTLSNASFWGEDLGKMQGANILVETYVKDLLDAGIRTTLESFNTIKDKR